jgi:hypothetical protein
LRKGQRWQQQWQQQLQQDLDSSLALMPWCSRLHRRLLLLPLLLLGRLLQLLQLLQLLRLTKGWGKAVRRESVGVLLLVVAGAEVPGALVLGKQRRSRNTRCVGLIVDRMLHLFQLVKSMQMGQVVNAVPCCAFLCGWLRARCMA